MGLPGVNHLQFRYLKIKKKKLLFSQAKLKAGDIEYQSGIHVGQNYFQLDLRRSVWVVHASPNCVPRSRFWLNHLANLYFFKHNIRKN